MLCHRRTMPSPSSRESARHSLASEVARAVVAPVPCQQPRPEERPDAHRAPRPALRAGSSARCNQSRPSRRWLCMCQNGQSDPASRSSASASPVCSSQTEDRPHVVVVGLDLVQPLRVRPRGDPFPRPFRQLCAPGRVRPPASPPPRRWPPTVPAVLPDRLQHPVPAAVGPLLPAQQALVHQRPEPFQHVDRIVAGDRDGGVKVEPADEDGQAAEKGLLLRASGGRGSRRSPRPTSADGPGASRGPSDSSRSRAESSASSASGDSSRSRAAANSRASGSPSSQSAARSSAG